MSLPLLIFLFFIVALLYSSVGFGGGSSYIALLLFSGVAMADVRFTALICNIAVVSGSVIYYYKLDLLKFKLIWPLIILSIPFALLGGYIQPTNGVYKSVAAVSLICASLLMFVNLQDRSSPSIPQSSMAGLGGGVGLLSGFVGIGGGIFLSPILHLINWQSAKIISATASFFILVNSLAGLAGQTLHNPNLDTRTIIPLVLAVIIGGRAGNLLNIHILSPEYIKYTTAVLIAFVGIRILYLQIY